MGRSGSRRGRAGAILAVLLAGMVSTGESRAGTTDVTIQYMNHNASAPNDDIIEANIKLRNDTPAAIALKDLVVRYWFTRNDAPMATPACWWWNTPSCAHLTVTSGIVALRGADRYVEIRFGHDAGFLAPGATTAAIDLGVTFGGHVDETDDYSYGTVTSFTDWKRITVHDVGSAPTEGLRGGTPPPPRDEKGERPHPLSGLSQGMSPPSLSLARRFARTPALRPPPSPRA